MATASACMRLEDFFSVVLLIHSDLPQQLRRQGLLGDFAGHNFQKCQGKGDYRLVKDLEVLLQGPQREDEYSPRGSWFEGSKLSLQQVILVAYFWVKMCSAEFCMHECQNKQWWILQHHIQKFNTAMYNTLTDNTIRLVNFEGLKFHVLSLFSIIQWYFILWGLVTSIQLYRCGRG